MLLSMIRILTIKSIVVFCLLFLFFRNGIVHAQSPNWVAPPSAKTIKNPQLKTPEILVDGKKLYISFCAPCHGDKGKGDGPTASALNPRPADHTSPALQSETDGSLFWKISEGRSPMPSYKVLLTETQRWELVNYIRSLSKP
jgi:mono/diheme cytochrome c family protein